MLHNNKRVCVWNEDKECEWGLPSNQDTVSIGDQLFMISSFMCGHFHYSFPLQRPAINLSGCSRTEKFNGIRSRRDMFSFLMSAYRPSRPTLDLMALEYAVISAETSGVAK